MHNGDDGSALIFVRWMYEMGAVLARPGWTGRTFVLLRVSLKLKVSLVFNTVWGRNFILIYYATMAMTVLHWTSFDECIWNGCRIVPGRTARTFVLLEFDTCYIVDHSTQYEVVSSRSCAVQICYNGNDGSALIFVCWMYGMGVARVCTERTDRTFLLLKFDVVTGGGCSLRS